MLSVLAEQASLTLQPSLPAVGSELTPSSYRAARSYPDALKYFYMPAPTERSQMLSAGAHPMVEVGSVVPDTNSQPVRILRIYKEDGVKFASSYHLEGGCSECQDIGHCEVRLSKSGKSVI